MNTHKNVANTAVNTQLIFMKYIVKSMENAEMFAIAVLMEPRLVYVLMTQSQTLLATMSMEKNVVNNSGAQAATHVLLMRKLVANVIQQINM